MQWRVRLSFETVITGISIPFLMVQLYQRGGISFLNHDRIKKANISVYVAALTSCKVRSVWSPMTGQIAIHRICKQKTISCLNSHLPDVLSAPS